jgi:O-antigen/teichoic acid export membrane protein
MTRPNWTSAFVWTSVSQGVLGGNRLVLSIVVAHQFGKEELGKTTALLSVATFAVMLWPQATGITAARFIATAKDEASRSAVSKTMFASSALLSFPLGAMAAWWCAVWLDASREQVGSVLLLVVALGLSATVRGIRNGRGQLRAAAAGDLAGALLALLVLFVLVDVEATSLIVCAFAIGFLPGIALGMPKRRAKSIRADERRAQRVFNAWTTIHILTASALLPLLTLVVATQSGTTTLGDFAAAASVATPMFLVSLASRSALEPFVAKLFSDAPTSPSSASTVDALFRSMVTVFVPVFGLAALWAIEIIGLLYSAEFAPAVPMLVIMLAAVGINSVNAGHVWLSSAAKHGPRLLAICNTAGLALGLACGGALNAVRPGVGAALGLLLGALISTGAVTGYVWRDCHMRWWPVVVKAALATALFGVLTAFDLSTSAKWVASLVALVGWFVLIRRDLGQVLSLTRLAQARP